MDQATQAKIKGTVVVITDKLQKWGFWVLIIFALGVLAGMQLSKGIYKGKLDDAIKLQGFIHNGTVYEVKIKP